MDKDRFIYFGYDEDKDRCAVHLYFRKKVGIGSSSQFLL